MRGLIIFLLMLWLLFSAACGYRTVPVPYAETDRSPDRSMRTITNARLNIQGDHWVFRWQIPKGLLLEQPLAANKTSIVDASADASGDASLASADASGDASLITKSTISQFRINILKSTAECSFCEPENIGHFLIDLTSGDVRFELLQGMGPPFEEQLFINDQRDIRFKVPLAFFRDNGFIDHCSYTIDYFLDNSQLSGPSPKLYPPDLKTLPLPKIRFRKWVGNTRPGQQNRIDSHVVKRLNEFLSGIPVDKINGETQNTDEPSVSSPLMLLLEADIDGSFPEETPLEIDPLSEDCKKPWLEYFILLEWDLQQETLRHTLQKDRKLNEQVVHYGINFYLKQVEEPLTEEEGTKEQDPFVNSEQLINPKPLLYGSFSLLNFQGQLSARHVDRFGNESESVPVFNGRY